MLKRELKVNFKGYLIWSGVTILMFLVVFLIYPSIINGPEADSINEMMKMFPPELLKSFNMDLASIDSAYGWLKSEGFVFILLIIGCYAGILGSNILLKEESDKTIEYLGVMPIKRTSIVLQKSLAGVVYIIGITAAVGVFNFIGLDLSGDFDKKQYIFLSLTPLLSCVPVFFVCMFLSAFAHKTKKMLGISLGLVILSYVFNTLSSLSENTEYLKYFSVFTLADIRNVIINISVNPLMIFISLFIDTLFLCMTIIRYNKKELV
ncbi:MAG: ABC transporter permease [Clostridiales bacterium]|nr:ABC transporter permease [Clostridiales bacterium]